MTLLGQHKTEVPLIVILVGNDIIYKTKSCILFSEIIQTCIIEDPSFRYYVEVVCLLKDEVLTLFS